MQCIGNEPKTGAANNSHGHVTQHAPDVNLVAPGCRMFGQSILIDPSKGKHAVVITTQSWRSQLQPW